MSHTEFAAQTFGMLLAEPSPPVRFELPLPAPGATLAVTGPSGAGKTLALNALAYAHGGLLLPELPHGDQRVLEAFPPALPGEVVLRNLARAGLADGRLWRMRTHQLSAGERQRLRIALALSTLAPGQLLLADEFDAHLDELTACAIAQTLRRIGVRLAVSTHNPATLSYLAPATLIEIDGGARELRPPTPRDMADEIEIVPGRALDWQRFKHWHYLGESRPGPSCAVWLARLRGRECGIVMFGYPHLYLSARAQALPERFHVAGIRTNGVSALNREVRLLQRVVVDPRLRGLGVATRLIKHGLQALDMPYVECIAQMGAFSDFLLRAGFRRVCAMEPPPQARALLRFCERRDIPARALRDPAARSAILDALPQDDRAALQRLLRALGESRVNTGHGSLRRRGDVGEQALHAALARLGARPEYFLWTR